MEPNEIHSAAREAQARAEMAAEIARFKNLRAKARRFRDGAFGRRGSIGKSGQVVVPSEIVKRWVAERVDGNIDGDSQARGIADDKTPVVILDLGWGVVVIPEHEARQLILDLDIEPKNFGARS